MKTLITLLAFLLLLSASQVFGITLPALHERKTGTESAEFTRVKQNYEKFSAEYRKDTSKMQPLVKIAQIFLTEARITGDHHYYYPAAEGLLNKVLEKNANDFEALVTKGSILMSYHKFSEALEIATKASKIGGGSAYTYGLLVDANIELGNYEEAVKNADKMVSLRPDLRSYSRVAYLRELYGDRTGAKAAMKMAADAGAFGQEDRAWCLKELANLYLGEGNLDTAEFIYKGIIEERPAYAFAYSGLAQIQIARKQFPDAIAILVKATQLSPEHIFIEQLADLYLTIGDTTSAVTMREKVFASFAQHEKDGWMVGKEYAAFCLGQSINPGEALMRAEKGYKTRPENIEALDVYSWALYKNGKAKEAAKYSEQAVRLGTDNAILYYHAAKIAQANADKIKAFSYFEKALARNPYMPVSMREDAIKSLSTLKKDS